MGAKVLKSKEYYTYRNIKARCFKEKHKDYKNYGGRGITMCDKWVHSYSEFLKDVKPAPSKSHSIDRINNNGNYEPGNVRWATKKQQARNKRNTILITYLCRTRILGEWCEILNLRYHSLHKAIRSNEDKKPSEVFSQFIISRIKKKYSCPTHKVKKRKDNGPRYYHDLQSVLIKHGFSYAKITP